MNFVSRIFALFIILDLQNIIRFSTMTNAIGDHPSLIMIRKHGDYFFPKCVHKVRHDNLDFSEVFERNNPAEIVHFCPISDIQTIDFRIAQHDYDFCLYENSKGDEKCAVEPQPVISQITDKRASEICADDKFTAYESGFRLCTREKNGFPTVTPDGHDTRNFENGDRTRIFKRLYTFCYDHHGKSMSHLNYKIFSPKLLRHEALQEERDLEATPPHNIVIFAYPELKADFATESSDVFSHVVFNKFNGTTLASPNNMTFKYWREAFHHGINSGYMYTYMENEWNAINSFIQKLAVDNESELEVAVGKYDEKNGVSHSWWTIVFNETRTQGIGIVLRNIPKKESMRIWTPEISCQLNCSNYGFGDISNETRNRVYCCHPKTIADKVGLQLRIPKDLTLLNVQNLSSSNVQQCPSSPRHWFH